MIAFVLTSIVIAQPSVREAEIQRLREQLRQYQENGSFEYSERFYLQMEDEDSSFEFLNDQDHLMGAMASNSKGDLAKTLERLDRCKDSERALKWHSYLIENTGQVTLKNEADAELVFLLGMLNPEQIVAISYANKILSNGQTFSGRLPNGAYQYGTKNFIVDISGMTTRVKESDMTSLKIQPSVNNSFYVGVTGGVLFLGEGIRPETGEELESSSMPLIGITTRFKMPGDTWYSVAGIAAQYGKGTGLEGTSLEPHLSLGYKFGKTSFELGTFVQGGVLVFPDDNYGKMGLGVGGLLGANVEIKESWNFYTSTKYGIFGSHKVTTVTSGINYQL